MAMLQVSAYGEYAPKTSTYMNFIMYLCVSLRMMHTDLSQSRNTQNREDGEGRGQGNIIDTERREELSGKTGV